MDRPGVRQVPEGSGEQGKMEKTGCKIICGAPTTLAVKGLMMMMMMMMMMKTVRGQAKAVCCRPALRGALCHWPHSHLLSSFFFFLGGYFFFSFFFFFLRLRWSFCTSYSFLHNSFLVARSGPKLFQFSLYTIRFVTTFCVLLGNFCALKDYWHLHFCGQIEIIDYYNYSAVSQETGSAGSQWSASQNRCHKWAGKWSVMQCPAEENEFCI